MVLQLTIYEASMSSEQFNEWVTKKIKALAYEAFLKGVNQASSENGHG